jgi:hypothetical protein
MKKALIILTSTVLLTQWTLLRVQAQTLSSLRIGDDVSRLATLGTPAATDKYKSFVVQKWNLANGNELSVTRNGAGKIVYIESDWGGRAETTECDLQNLKFGVTTLSDLRRRFGSNGFGFKGRGAVISIPDGIVMMNSYEAATSVVTFFTKVIRSTAGSQDSTPVADRAKLDAISIADAAYADSEWGQRASDPRYKQIEWK